MTQHISKEELKKNDAFLQEGRKFFISFQHHAQQIGIGVAVIIILVVGVLFFNHNSTQKEMELQTQFYKIEKSYLKKKENLEKTKAEATETAAAASAPSTEPKEDTYKTEVEQFTQLIQAHPQSIAASMSALIVTEILSESKKFEDAQKLLESVFQKSKGHQFARALVGHTLGTIEANLGRCEKAISVWEPLMKEKKLDYMVQELQLKSAVCYSQIGQTQKAEELLTNLKAKPESLQGRTAEKYLRLLNIKKQL